MPGLGRKASPLDPRDYRLSAYIVTDEMLRVSRILFRGTRREWACDTVLNQGDSQHCVGFSCAQFGNALPIDSHKTEQDAHALYYAAKRFEGELGEDGATLRDGAKAMKEAGMIDAYAFAHTIDEVATWLDTRGPVVVGTNWYSYMTRLSADYFAEPDGLMMGGHAWLLIGFDFTNPTRKHFIGLNSWGRDWGNAGRFYIRTGDMARLLKNGGEAVTAVEIESTDKPNPS